MAPSFAEVSVHAGLAAQEHRDPPGHMHVEGFHVFDSLLFLLSEENEEGKYVERTPQTSFKGIFLCLQSFKPQLPYLRQYPNSGTMIECCFYSHDMLMLVPQSKIFI